jgi:hypothetical protein
MLNTVSKQICTVISIESEIALFPPFGAFSLSLCNITAKIDIIVTQV